MDEVKPVARVPTAEHREPCESRGSRTVLGARGGEIPPRDSTFASFSAGLPDDRGRDASYLAPPAQIRASGIPARGSHLGYLTAKRTSGQG